MIVPMKKAMLIVLREDRDAVTEALQRCGELMPIPPEDQSFHPETAEETLRAQQALRMMKPYQPKKGMFAPRPEISFQELLTPDEEARKLLEETERISAESESAAARISEIRAKIEEIRPWIRMDIPVEALGGTKSAGIYSGYIDPSKADLLWEAAEKRDGAVIQLDTGSQGTAVLVYTYRQEEEGMLEDLAAIGFSQAAPPGDGLPKDTMQQYEKELAEAEKMQTAAREKLTELAQKSEKLEIYCDQSDAAQEREETPFGETMETFYLEGWVRSDRTDRLKKALEKATDCFDLTFVDPEPEDNPPTVTKNNRFISQFETITDMFSRPKNGELDPNPVMGPWYWIIFGLMMGDAGYGLLMLIGLWAFKKLKKPRGDMAKLVNVMFFSSFTTIFWGIVFGSYFGETWHPLLFGPLDNPMGMLIFCMIIGVLHIFSGMAMKMAADIKAGHFWDAIFDQFSWMMLIAGLGLLFLPQTQTVGAVLAIAGAAIVFLTAGRAKKGIVGKIVGGFGGLYGITGYMSDILSYSRILALSLATGVVGMVMNLLAGMVQGSVIGFILSLAIYAAGHLFNLAMGLLSAYVHDSRLQYIEFFNKFYEGGGYAFRPLQVSPRFVDVTSDGEN
ncbi:MAG: V-type ATP synthase subunit I [Candidatus Merdivicinus sp.]|jgi:V/A-type H+-transporting ATPase subunit I